jgi:NAD(P)-dependent dehydrogenase (short-subunit alcohol dehydrogenase family)
MATPQLPDPRKQGPRPPFPPQEQEPTGQQQRMTPEPDCGETSYRGIGRLRDRVALITGGDSGIGRAVAIAFSREGADVAIGYYEQDQDAQSTQKLVEEAGRQGLSVAADLADPEACRRLVHTVVERFGRIDVLVNNAAWQGESAKSFADIDPARIDRTFRVNIEAMFHVVQAALPHMSPGATIINTSSIQAYRPNPGILDYACTKAAIVAFTKGLAQDLIERGIRVNSVAPGPVWTPLVAQSFDREHLSHFGEKSPMGRPAQPAELAPAYVFLASEDGRYVNGEILGVTGQGGLP